VISASVTTKEKDLGMKDLLRRLRSDASHVDIGIQADEDEQLIIIAAANEFGTITIPARSYIRSTVDENNDKYLGVSKKLMGKIVSGDMTKTEALAIMGQMIEGDIKRKIISLRSPPNAPSTIRAKGSDNPLVDTGLLGGSIRFVVKSEGEDE